jgi:hypothetical protein
MDYGLGPCEGVITLPRVGQIGDEALSMRAAVVCPIHVENLVPGIPQMPHGPTSSLASASSDDDLQAFLQVFIKS